MNYLISRLNLSIGNVESALKYIENILKIKRELFDVYMVEQYLYCLNNFKNNDPNSIPILLLPTFNSEETILNLTPHYSANSSLESNQKENNSEMWNRFEKELYQTNNKSALSALSYQRPIFTRFTDNSIHPIVCKNDKMIISVEVMNPIASMIFLKKLHLLWELSYENETHKIHYNNESNVESNNYITIDTINEVKIESLEKRKIDFLIQPNIEGHIKITGLEYILELPVFRSNEITKYHQKFSESNYKTFGKQLLEIKGSRTVTSTAQRFLNNIDNRLNIKILSKLPLLEVKIENCSDNMLCDELICANLFVRNISDLPIKNLTVASDYKNYLIFDDVTEAEGNGSPRVKKFYKKALCDSNLNSKKRIDLIHKFKKTIEPFEMFMCKIWIQAPNHENVSKVNFMFYYENANENVHKSLR